MSITSAEDDLFLLDSDTRFGPCEHSNDAETQTAERRAGAEAFDANSSARIVIRDVHKTFTLHTQGGTKLAVLANAALRVDAGECVALTGPSGTGKSTLLRCLYGNYLPTQGSISVRQQDAWIDLTTADPTQIVQLRKSTIGWVSQFLRVIPRIETLDIVAEPLIQQGVAKADARDRAAAILTRLNVPEKLWSLAPATFSGGEQQRVNVARGLVGDHGILLIDEPTASLDPANCEVVVSLLCEARDRGTALVGIFHDPAVRDAVATRVLEITLLTP
jgi:alpha-D-ribose 1-methylphosphonate 5-triphosphate synthase subunit PhnL